MKKTITKNVTLYEGSDFTELSILKKSYTPEIFPNEETSSFSGNLLLVTNAEAETAWAEIEVNYNVSLPRTTIDSAKLIFERVSGNTDAVSLYDAGNLDAVSLTKEEERIVVDISDADTDCLLLATFTLRVEEGGSFCELTRPILELTYTYEFGSPPSNENYTPTKKEFPMPSGTAASFDTHYGITTVTVADTHASDSPLGASIAHVHRPDCEDTVYGKGFRLNLDERLVQTETNTTDAPEFIYTDGMGEKHGFSEYFYYLKKDGAREYVTAAEVETDAEGNLTHEGKTVYREFRSATGWEATARLDDVKNLAILEQRTEEERELEEQKTVFEDAFLDFVLINKKTGGKYRSLSAEDIVSFEKVQAFAEMTINPEDSDIELLLLTQEDGISYKALVLQKNAPEPEYPITSNAGDLYYINTVNDDEIVVEGQAAVLEQSEANEGNDPLDEQMKIFLLRDVKNRKQLKKVYPNYRSVCLSLSKLRELLPVSYLRRDGIVKGFNAEGYLCAIFDAYENYLAIDRDAEHRVESVYDKNGNAITFHYEEGNLCCLTDRCGCVTRYTYDGDLLTKVTYASGNTVSLTYDANGNVATVTTAPGDDPMAQSGADALRASFTYAETDYPIQFSLVSLASGISYANIEKEEGPRLAKYLIAYSDTFCFVTDTERNFKVRYRLTSDGNLSAYTLEEHGLVTRAEQYAREVTAQTRTETVTYAKEDTLYKKPLTTFTFEADKTVTTVFNNASKPTMQTEAWTDGETTYRNETVYAYDDKERLCKVTQTAYKNDVEERSVVTEQFYNAQGKVIRTERYLVGAEATLGRTVEETKYDENGNILCSFSYNTLDPSSKLYTENERDALGRTAATLDATGKHKTVYEYLGDSTRVRSERYPSGGATAFAYDKNGECVSVTSSTEEGEGNTSTTFYTAGEVTRLVSGNHTVDYEYDGKRRLTAVKLDGEDYISYTYGTDEDGNDTVSTVYANALNNAIVVTTNDRGQLLRQDDSGGTFYSCEYESDGRLKAVHDVRSIADFQYIYDEKKRLTGYSYHSVNEALQYDNRDRLAARTVNNGNPTGQYNTIYNYAYNDQTNRLSSMTANGITLTPKHDALGRPTGKVLSTGSGSASEEISYLKQGDHATMLPSVVQLNAKGRQDRIKYFYDAMGNIVKITENGLLSARYEYDALGRLTREDNRAMAKTCLYTYDENGNILSRREYAYTVKPTEQLLDDIPTDTALYRYNGDRMISYNGQTCTYDALGNPTTYRGKSLTWEKGRMLRQYGNAYINYEGTFRYYYFGSTFLSLDHEGWIVSDNALSYLYDESGNVFGCIDRATDTKYLYQKDALGNIIAVLDNTGALVVKYVYDAWGNHKVLDASGAEITDTAHIGKLNSFRYRGYYYCSEIGLYYLKSRFYDPVVGRFINADSVEYLDPSSVNGLNLYAYCGNNPVMNVDPSGTIAVLTILAVVLGVVAVAATINDIYQIASGNTYGTLSDQGDVAIEGSHKVLTPWVQGVYSFYLNYFNPETKDIIKGTTGGVQGEWMAHNIGYYLFASLHSAQTALDVKWIDAEAYMGYANPANVGATVFDNGNSIIGILMKVYNLITRPIPTIIDWFIHLSY